MVKLRSCPLKKSSGLFKTWGYYAMITSSWSFQVIISGLWMGKWHLWVGAAAWNNICAGWVWGGLEFILYLCAEISANHWRSRHQCWWPSRSGSILMAINQAGRYTLYFSRPLCLPCSENNTTIQTAQREEDTSTAKAEGDKQISRIYQHGHPKRTQCASQQLRKEVRHKEQTQGAV